MTSLPETRHSLIVRLSDPLDLAAWQEFTAIYEPAVYRLARRRGLQDADARDVTQETLTAVARAIGERTGAVEKGARPTGSFRAWLHVVARNLAINRLTRQRARTAPAIEGVIPFAPTPELTAAFDREFRLAALAWAGEHVQREVAPETWQAFWLTAVDGRPIPEVAAELQLGVGSVYAARSRVMARLRKRLEDLDEATRERLFEETQAAHRAALADGEGPR